MNQLSTHVNLSAYKAGNQLKSHYSNINKAVQRLSSGLRLNSSADAPVDYAVWNQHESRLAVLYKGRQNLNDAISMVQTAEAAMAQIDNLLIQMKEIAGYAATGTINSDQREILSTEFNTLASEIDRIAQSCEFKGIKLLTGNLSVRNNIERQGEYISTNKKLWLEEDLDPSQIGLKIHFGPMNSRFEDYYFIKIGDLRMKALSDPVAVSTQHAAQVALETLNSAMQKKESNRYMMGIMQNRLEASLAYREDEILQLQGASSKLGDADFIDEMMNFSKYNLLAQAAQAMSSQANVLPQIALKLLSV